MPLIDDLLHYLVWRVTQQGGWAGKTRLIKLLYLVDLQTARSTGAEHGASGTRWLFYHYGPYGFEIEDALQRSADDALVLERRTTEEGYEAHLFAPTRTPDQNILPQPLRARCDRWADQWALTDLNELLDFVYFATPPMREARRHERLDLLAHLEEDWPPSARPLPPPTVSNRLRQLYEERRGGFDRLMPKRDLPPRPFLSERDEGNESRPLDLTIPVHNVRIEVSDDPEW